MPSICVVLCTYDGEAFLAEQLDSIAAQSRLPDRLLIVDDCSQDGTVDIATRFAAGAPFEVDVIRNRENLGFSLNFERGIGLATGDVTVLCDQDDVWMEHRLARIARVFDENPAAALVFSDAEVVNSQLGPLGYRAWEAAGFSRRMQEKARDGRMLEVLAQRTVVTGATAAFRNEYRWLILPIDPEVEHDAWIALLLSAVAPVVPIPEPLIRYRQHAQNQIGARRWTLMDRVRRSREMRMAGLERRRKALLSVLRRMEDAGVAISERGLLSDAVDHLAIRTSLGDQRFSRVVPVFRELANGRYSRLSGGLASTLRDLLV